MFQMRRLDQCYEDAKIKQDIVHVDDNTKIIFFSDVHRGDNSLSDEFAHNQNIYYYALESYLNKGYQYIELGDGDELWEYGSFSTIRSSHSDIFCLLKEYYKLGRFTYLYGNHNMIFKHQNKVKEFMESYFDDYKDQTTDLFQGIETKESMILKDTKTEKEILMIHGHQGDFTNDQGWFISAFLVKVFWRYMHRLGFQNPSSPSKSRIKRHKIEKSYTKWIHANRIGILCGHTHRPKLPDIGETVYLNSGCCIHPRGITGIELVGREFFLIHWNIKTVRKGHLAIKKNIVKGPISFDELNL